MAVRVKTIVRRDAERQFLDDTSGLGPLDEHALPLTEEKLRRVSRDNSDPLMPDPRFAGLTCDSGVGAKALKDFLRNLDAEAVHETRDPDLIENFQREQNSLVHLAGHTANVRKEGAGWIAELSIDGEMKTVHGESRDEVLGKLVAFARALKAERNRVSTRQLTEAETLECIRYAQQGRTVDAIGRYLYHAFDRREIEPFAILDNPAYRDLCDEAVTLAWVHSRNSYSPTPEREKFIRDFCAGRPLTISLLDGAWEACQRQEARAANVPELTPEPGPVELDDLSDAEIQATYRAAMRARARS